MGVKLGLDTRMYRNTGTYAAPVWNEIKNVRDVTLNLETGESDVTTRGNGGWRANIATLKSASLEFEMMWDTVDDDFIVIRDAFLANGAMEFAVKRRVFEVATQVLRSIMCVLQLCVAVSLVFEVIAEGRMNLREGQPGQLQVDLIGIPAICEMAFGDLGNFCSWPLNEGNASFVQFNKRPCSGDHRNSPVHKSSTIQDL